MSKSPADYIFKGRSEEVLVKTPGSIRGNGFVLDTLKDCEVYILDHTTQVQVDDCINCKIFIGPCDGSVFIRDCKDCTLNVATRQLRTRDCANLKIGLYCATQPSIETSTCVEFSCWRGAYPGLTQHFGAAKLDPSKNTWMQVYDFNSGDDLGAPHWSLDESFRGWWVAPTEGVPDCPVVAADGSLFGGGHAEPPPKSPGSALPDSLPPSPGRAQNWDEEVEIDDDEPPVVLPADDGGFVALSPPPISPRGRALAAAASFSFGPGGGNGAAEAPPPMGGDDLFGAPAQAATTAPAPVEQPQQPAAASLPMVLGDDQNDNPFFSAPSAAAPPVAIAAAVPAAAVEDARLAWRTANSQQLAKADTAERAAREKIKADANAKLESLSKTRETLLQKRHSTHRSQQATEAGGGKKGASLSGATGWERVAELLDARANAAATAAPKTSCTVADLARFKQLVIALKNKQQKGGSK